MNLMLNGGFCVDLRAGNLLILLLTRMSMRAPFRWSPLFTWIYIITTHHLSSQENCTHAILTLRGFVVESKLTCPSHFINRLTKDAACSCADFCFCNSGQYRAIECDQSIICTNITAVSDRFLLCSPWPVGRSGGSSGWWPSQRGF